MKPTVIILLAAVAGIALPSCGEREKVANTVMPAMEKETLTATLAKLDETLAAKSPFVAAKLAPGATDDDVKALRSELGGAQVECLEEWFRWHNGCQGGLTDLIPLGRMLSISEAIKDRQDIQSVPLVDAKRKQSLKILEDGAGDGFFVDVTSQHPRVFYHMLEDPSPRDYGTLPEFATLLIDVHASELATENEHGMVSFDLARYQKVEAAYLNKIEQAAK
jgi:hypothetical protein